MNLFFSSGFSVAGQGIACIINHDIKMKVLAKVLCSRSESGVYRASRSDIQDQLENIGILIRKVRESRHIASCGDQALVWLTRNEVGDFTTDAG